MHTPSRFPITAAEFFAYAYDGADVLEAHYASRVGLTTLREYIAGRRGLSLESANALQAWSEGLHHLPTYISAAKTLGVRAEIL
jgi:hypothetical protein